MQNLKVLQTSYPLLFLYFFMYFIDLGIFLLKLFFYCVAAHIDFFSDRVTLANTNLHITNYLRPLVDKPSGIDTIG
jgi:hypothetical protein